MSGAPGAPAVLEDTCQAGHRIGGRPAMPFVRPYIVTHGRTEGVGEPIPIETLVVAQQDADGLDPDRAAVVSLCREPLSVAEIAAHIHHAIGVARVLVADLTASGHVIQYGTEKAPGAALVNRLIRGIRAL